MKPHLFLIVALLFGGTLSCSDDSGSDDGDANPSENTGDSGSDGDSDSDGDADSGIDSGSDNLPDYIGYIERTITKDNPWVEKANKWVNDARKRYEKHGGSSNSNYDRSTHRNGTIPWLAWGYGSELSEHYGEIEYLNIGIEMMDILFTHQGDPSFLTSAFEILLPAYLLKRYGAPDDKVKEWGEKYIEKGCRSTYDNQLKSIDNINSATPNIDHAAAAKLEYCYQILGSYPNWKDDAANWHELAARIVAKMDKAILPDGAFAYHVHGKDGHTGPAAFYDRINVSNLVYYHLVTNDPVARHGLKALSDRYRVVNKARCTEITSIPFWKTGDGQWRKTGWTTVLYTASISQDPVTSALSELNRGYNLGVLIFPLMFYWNEDLVSGELPTKFARYNATTGGPIFRDGDLNISMTAHNKSATPIGLILTQKDKNEVELYTSQLALTIRHSNKKQWDVPARNAMENQAVIITDDWVAMGTVFDTRGAIVGGEGKSSDWDKSELWFADSGGFVGGSLLECTKDTKLDDIYAYVQFKSDVDTIDIAHQSVIKKGVTFTITGNSVSTIKKGVTLLDGTEKPGVTAVIGNAGQREYTVGDSFDWGLAMRTSDAVVYEDPAFQNIDSLSVRSFVRDGKKAFMVYNRSETSVTWKPDSSISGQIWNSEKDKYAIIAPQTYAYTDVTIPSKGLIVIKEE